MTTLKGKRAVVIGAAGDGNMGQVIAKGLAAEGASVLVAGRQKDKLDAFASEINGAAAVCDITNRDSVSDLLASAKQSLGGCDILVNAAGMAIATPTLSVSDDELNTLTDLHVKGVFHLLQIFGAEMAAQQSGAIVQVSSATLSSPVDNSALYIGTKAAGDYFVKAFAQELGEHGAGVQALGRAHQLGRARHNQHANDRPDALNAWIRKCLLGAISTWTDRHLRGCF